MANSKELSWGINNEITTLYIESTLCDLVNYLDDLPSKEKFFLELSKQFSGSLVEKIKKETRDTEIVKLSTLSDIFISELIFELSDFVTKKFYSKIPKVITPWDVVSVWSGYNNLYFKDTKLIPWKKVHNGITELQHPANQDFVAGVVFVLNESPIKVYIGNTDNGFNSTTGAENPYGVELEWNSKKHDDIFASYKKHRPGVDDYKLQLVGSLEIAFFYDKPSFMKGVLEGLKFKFLKNTDGLRAMHESKILIENFIHLDKNGNPAQNASLKF